MKIQNHKEKVTTCKYHRIKLTLFSAMAAILMLPALSTSAQTLEAICVPWVSHAEDRPHFSYDGATTRLKGIARGDATEFKWEYGDGGETAWMPIVNPYNLSVQHAYTGVPGQLFIAILHVRNAVAEDQDTYRVQLFESSNLRIAEHLEVRKSMAIDEGLWWMHIQMVRSTFAAGAPGYEQPYGYWDPSYYPLASVGTGIDAFQLAGHTVVADYDNDPYVETIQRAMNYMLYSIRSYAISPQPAGDPDTNGNGIGLVANNTSINRQTYIGGICMATLASCGAPNKIAAVGNADVFGRTYKEIVQDMVDFFSFGQVDSGWGRGGWRYYANYSESDMSTAQWPPLGMLAAEQNMGIEVPSFVRSELQLWLTTCQNLALNNDNGCFAYYYPGSTTYYNITKAAAGMISYEFLYMVPPDPSLTLAERLLDWDAKQAAFRADPRVQAAEGFIYRHWNDTGTSWNYTRLHGNSYGMYGVMKAMRLTDPDIERVVEFDYNSGVQTANSFDWFFWPAEQTQEGLAHYTIQTQQADGSWDDNVGANRVYDGLATGWRILILLPDVVIRPPVAVISDVDKQEYNLDQDIELDGSESFHTDPRRTLVRYEWDFDYNGTFAADALGTTASIPGGYPLAGIYPVALRVTDDNPSGALEDITVANILVHEPPHMPHAYIGGPYNGFVNMPVQLNASRSWDPDDAEFPYLGDPLEFTLIEWDLDNDGLFGTDDGDCFGEASDATGVLPQWTWNTPFEGVIGLKVTDVGVADSGQIYPPTSDFDYTVVRIGNHSPVADAGGPYLAPPNGSVMLDGTGSFDIDPGDSITYAWDLDGDGDYDDSSDSTPEFFVSGVTGQVYDVSLEVTDSFGQTDRDYTTVTITGNNPPVADANGPYSALPNTTISLDASNSYDPDPGDSINFDWDLDDDGQFDDSSALFPAFSVSGEIGKVYVVSLKVTDSFGEMDTNQTTVTIVPQSVGCPGFVTNCLPPAVDILEYFDCPDLYLCTPARRKEPSNDWHENRATGQTFTLNTGGLSVIEAITLKKGTAPTAWTNTHTFVLALLKDTDGDGLGDLLMAPPCKYDFSGLVPSTAHPTYFTFLLGDGGVDVEDGVYQIEVYWDEIDPGNDNFDMGRSAGEAYAGGSALAKMPNDGTFPVAEGMTVYASDFTFYVLGSATPLPSPFLDWAIIVGLTPGQNDAFTDNPDGDCLNNLMEYAVNGNPLGPDMCINMFTDNEHFYHIHNQRTDDPTLIYTVEACTNLCGQMSWTTDGVDFVGESAPVDSYKSVTNRTVLGNCGNMRLKVEKN